jgi:hypothetical protein
MKFLPREGFQEFSVSAFDKTEIGTATTGLRLSVHLRRDCVAPSPSPQEYIMADLFTCRFPSGCKPKQTLYRRAYGRSIKGQCNEIDIFEVFALMVLKVFQELFTTLYNY